MFSGQTLNPYTRSQSFLDSDFLRSRDPKIDNSRGVPVYEYGLMRGYVPSDKGTRVGFPAFRGTLFLRDYGMRPGLYLLHRAARQTSSRQSA